MHLLTMDINTKYYGPTSAMYPNARMLPDGRRDRIKKQ